MSNEIQSIINNYRQKYPLYNHEALVEQMIKDGAISRDAVNKFKPDTSLFLIDNQFNIKSGEKLGITEIMGGYFSSVNEIPPETSFNRQIENTFQSKTQGDCWLLSDINALNQTDWGKDIIRNAIIPDNNGGVIIRFPGSPIEQKDFQITAQEIQTAKQSGHYSKGDDDMIALELATEKVAKEVVARGIGRRVEDFDEVIGHKSYLTNILLNEKTYEYLNISKLLTGRDDVVAEFRNGLPESENILKYLAENPENTSAVCTFDHLRDVFGQREKDDPVHGYHAYAVKKIDYGKSVTVIDPYHTDEEINLSWDKFVNDVESVFATAKDDETVEAMKNSLPENYFELKQQKLDESLESLRQTKLEQEKILQESKQRKINFEVEDIINSIQYLEDDIKNNEKRFPKLYLNFTRYKTAMNKLTKDNILSFLEKEPDIILLLDRYKSGLFNGNDKKELILPIINALAEKAKERNIDDEIVEQFKKTCNKELDAVFYTDEKIIQNEVEKIIEKIK